MSFESEELKEKSMKFYQDLEAGKPTEWRVLPDKTVDFTELYWSENDRVGDIATVFNNARNSEFHYELCGKPGTSGLRVKFSKDHGRNRTDIFYAYSDGRSPDRNIEKCIYSKIDGIDKDIRLDAIDYKLAVKSLIDNIIEGYSRNVKTIDFEKLFNKTMLKSGSKFNSFAETEARRTGCTPICEPLKNEKGELKQLKLSYPLVNKAGYEAGKLDVTVITDQGKPRIDFNFTSDFKGRNGRQVFNDLCIHTIFQNDLEGNLKTIESQLAANREIPQHIENIKILLEPYMQDRAELSKHLAVNKMLRNIGNNLAESEKRQFRSLLDPDTQSNNSPSKSSKILEFKDKAFKVLGIKSKEPKSKRISR